MRKVETGAGGGGLVNAVADTASVNLTLDGGGVLTADAVFGTGAGTVAEGDDARLSDARAPTAHASSHQAGGSDALSGNLDANARTVVSEGGTAVGTRRGLNLIEGANVTLTVADNPTDERVDVTVAATGGGGGMANPMTALGDLIYEDATPGAARLAGNTSATKQFLTQTGDGTASAAPAWGAIAAGDVPTLNQSTTGTAANVTGTVAIANGGTGQTAQQAAIDALTGTQGAGKYLRSDGTHASLAAIQAADVPTLNQNTTGTASNVTGTVAVAKGGTGQTTQQAAIDALTGTQSSGKVLRSDGTHATLSSLVAGDLPNLNQSQTHGSPDTDASAASLHHTLGTTANQAAAGNHTHAASGANVAGANGQAWLTASGAPGWVDDLRAINFVIDGGGSAITTGDKGWLRIPFACSVVNWQVQGDASGAIAIDLLRAVSATPTTYASIVSTGTKPGLSSQQDSGIVAPSGWGSTAFAADTWLKFNVTSASTVKLVTVSLLLRRS